tara:strand:+ start:874 stop:2034 length:1161 start_codon:yes stop_codon:yes gene_type:complete
METTNLKLPQLVERLQGQNVQKADFVVPAQLISMKEGRIIFPFDEIGQVLAQAGINTDSNLSLEIMDVFHGGICDKLGIPRNYYNKMVGTHNALRDENVNHWLQNVGGNIMVRTFVDRVTNTGYARALLSDRYELIDNYDVLIAALTAIRETGLNVVVDVADITERKMYVRFTCPDIEIQAPELMKHYRNPNTGGVGSGVVLGFIISNSEVGQGTFSIAPRLTWKVCNNGMIVTADAYNRTHLGARKEVSSITWSEETKTKTLELVCSQVKDAIKYFATADYLSGKVQKIMDLNNPIEHPADTIRVISKELTFTEAQEKSVLDYFIKSGDMTSFGVVQAITFHAHADNDADARYDIESASENLIEKVNKADKVLVQKTVKELVTAN